MKFPSLVASALFFLSMGSQLRAQIAIEGRVTLRKPSAAPVVNQRYGGAVDPSVIVPDPPRAVVYLDGDFPPPKTAPHAEMAQKNLSFATPLLPVQAGAIVEFPNLDDTFHNIFSYSKPKRFDLGRYRGDERPIPSEVFDKPGVVPLHCDIHEHMHAIILVLASPCFAVTNPEGKYRLENLPAGHFTVKAWVDSRTTLEHAVDLKPGAVAHLDFP